jgi:hypothetical protein
MSRDSRAKTEIIPSAPPREDFLLGGKAMDANKDGRLTPEEIQASCRETRRSVPRQ